MYIMYIMSWSKNNGHDCRLFRAGPAARAAEFTPDPSEKPGKARKKPDNQLQTYFLYDTMS